MSSLVVVLCHISHGDCCMCDVLFCSMECSHRVDNLVFSLLHFELVTLPLLVSDHKFRIEVLDHASLILLILALFSLS